MPLYELTTDHVEPIATRSFAEMGAGKRGICSGC
jgi:hypothetical protein